MMFLFFSPEDLTLMAQGSPPNAIMQFAPIVIIMVIFYVLLIMPAQRRQKKLQNMIDNLKSGDKVITSGGIYGTIVGFKDDRIQLRIAENVKVELS